jgi:hypothetical protein
MWTDLGIFTVVFSIACPIIAFLLAMLENAHNARRSMKAAAGMMEAQAGFRRLKAHRRLPALRRARA